MNKSIKIYETRITNVRFCSNDVFELNSQGSCVWLQRICFWILRKLKCHAMLNKDVIKSEVINISDVMENIQRQQNNIMHLLNQFECEVFVGQEEMWHIRDNAFVSPVTVGSEYEHDGHVLGMDITVVPWMQGVLVVPKKRNKVNS